jgi:hypothetical protein
MGGNDISKNESKVDDNNSSSEEDCLDGWDKFSISENHI